MRTTWVLLCKELLEHLRTFKLLTVIAVLLVFGLGTPLLLIYIPDLLELSEQAMVVTVPEVTTADAVKAWLDTLGQIGLLVAILIGMGSIAVERERGTAELVLSKPVGTGSFVAAKLLGLAAVLAAGLVAGGAGCYAYTMVLLGEPDPMAYAAANALAGLYLLAVLAVTVLFSALMRNQIIAGVLALAMVISTALLGGLSPLSPYMPSSLMQWAYGLVLETPDPARVGALVATLGVIVAGAVGARQALQRQEV